MKDHQPFAFAGLWDRWKVPDGTVVESITINAVTPNDLLKHVHNRMPCIVGRENYLRWLNPDERRAAAS
jgi:putative SOS response-associated peptidase YedK